MPRASTGLPTGSSRPAKLSARCLARHRQPPGYPPTVATRLRVRRQRQRTIHQWRIPKSTTSGASTEPGSKQRCRCRSKSMRRVAALRKFRFPPTELATPRSHRSTATTPPPTMRQPSRKWRNHACRTRPSALPCAPPGRRPRRVDPTHRHRCPPSRPAGYCRCSPNASIILDRSLVRIRTRTTEPGQPQAHTVRFRPHTCFRVVSCQGTTMGRQRAIGDKVVWRTVSDCGVHHIARTNTTVDGVSPRGEMDEPAVSGTTAHPLRALVLPSLSRGDEQLDLGTDEFTVLLL